MYTNMAQCGLCGWRGIFPNEELASSMLTRHHELAHNIYLKVDVIIDAEFVDVPAVPIKELEANNGN